MNKDKFLQTGLLEQYVLGLTDEAEAREVEAYAEAYPEIAQEIKEMRGALDDYARQYAIMPPEELKSRVMKEIEGSGHRSDPAPSAGQEINGSGSFSALSSWVNPILVIGLMCLSFLFYRGKANAELQLSSLSNEYSVFRQDCEEEKESLRQAQRVYASLNQPGTRPYELKGTALNPNAVAWVYLNQEEQVAYLNAQPLPAPPPGKTYQLWADVEGEMINMGVVDYLQKDLQLMNFIAGAESLNITIEPEGGSDHPTVELLLANVKV
ncbi:anti-sigma factor [Phaeodactylibacter luteus]|uniref:Regulator of SigK n=1 Tax=Phaeodactylibacter luteus TaxID=1564516 RepID=A0A5C6RQ73_9BACT|nr:anti-sigma factor [Phaeodactylibacter luteus]TXB64114.1 anti-sigma factor [Phaeodactylibacter luteus]